MKESTNNVPPTAELRRTLHDRAICVLIPTFNNVATIGRVVEETLLYCDDVIVVDDGSTDGTGDVLKAIDRITLVSYKRNRGKGYALKCGIRKALELGFAYAITMDADGQHLPEEIPAFLDANKRWPGCLVLGKRKMENVVRPKKSVFANKFANFWFCVQTWHKLPDTQTGFRLYPLKKLYGYRFITSRYEAELELLVFASWHGVGIHSIPVDVYYPPKEERVSHFRPASDFARISLLNTCLCVLAILYGLPLYIIRSIVKVLRTLAAYLLLLLITVFFWPTLLIYIKCGRMTEQKRHRLHRIIYRVIKFFTLKVGVPGVKLRIKANTDTDFDTPSVIVCNHQSSLDILYLLSLTPKIVFLTNDWVWSSPLFGFIIHAAEYYPASYGIGNLMPHFRSLVERGYSIAIFPEGTRSADCHLARFHNGALFVATELNIPVVPIILYGTGRVLRKGSHHLRHSPVYIEVEKMVEPMQFEKLGDLRARTRSFHAYYQRHYDEISNKIEQDV